MFKRLDPTDVDKTPFKVYKQFTVTNEDSGSFVYNFRAISSSAAIRNSFDPATAESSSFQSASFYHLPAWHMINNRYYRQKAAGVVRTTPMNPYNNFGSNSSKQYRMLHESASIISVSKDLYGERIKPKSITLKDDRNMTALEYAIRNAVRTKNKDILELLINNNPSITSKDLTASLFFMQNNNIIFKDIFNLVQS